MSIRETDIFGLGLSSDSHPFKKKTLPSPYQHTSEPLGTRIIRRRAWCSIYWSVLSEIAAPRDNKWVSSTVPGHLLRRVFQVNIYKVLHIKESNIFLSHWVVLTTKCQSAGLRSTCCHTRTPTGGSQGTQFLRLQPPLCKGFWQDTSHSSTRFPGHCCSQVYRACCQLAVSEGVLRSGDPLLCN